MVIIGESITVCRCFVRQIYGIEGSLHSKCTGEIKENLVCLFGSPYRAIKHNDCPITICCQLDYQRLWA